MAKTRLEKKVREIETSMRDDGQIPKTSAEVDTVAQKLNQIELVLKEILEILKRKHPSSTDIFGSK